MVTSNWYPRMFRVLCGARLGVVVVIGTDRDDDAGDAMMP